MKIRKRPADAVVGDRQLSACVLGLAYDRFWVDLRRSGFGQLVWIADAVMNYSIVRTAPQTSARPPTLAGARA